MMLMLLWWYSDGYTWFRDKGVLRITRTYQSFSVSKLIKTFFVPWKLTAVDGGIGPATILYRLISNMISRLVGATIRFWTICLGLLSTVFVAICWLVGMVIWPLLPVAIVAFPVLAVLMWVRS